jgi:exopolysaccharide biosynthesis WecB/TagA/CpsF family protein
MDNTRYAVAFFMHDLAGGGVERMRLNLVRALMERGHDVTLIVQFRRGALCDQLPDRLPVVALDTRGVVATAVALGSALRAIRPQFLVSSLDHNNIAAMCAGAISQTRTKVVVCQHNALSAERALGWKYRAVPLCYRLLSHHAAAIIAVSYGVADDLATITGIARARISVIANPVISVVHPQRRSDVAPHPWLETADIPVFVFVGRLVQQKDPQVLLAAFALRFRHGPARLAILGEGPLLPELRTQADALGITQHVVFAGFVHDPAAWVERAQALVMPSRYEGFGNVIVEALGCGTPVIAADCPHGPAEILGHGQFGRLVPVGDADALARAMQGELRGEFPPELLRGRAASFSVVACVERHEHLFASLSLAQKRPVFGVYFSRLDAVGIARLIVASPAEDRVRLIVTPNSDHIRLLQRPAFVAAYQNAAIICPDGKPVALYAWLRGATAPRRVTGTDIFHELVRRPDLQRLRVFVLVEAASTEAALRIWLEPRGLTQCWEITTAPADLSGDAARRATLLTAIRAYAPDVLVLTLGAPVSEEFVHLHAASLPHCWALCVGQAVRAEIGLVRRAPGILRVAGLEWAWRVMQEPKRMLPRYIADALWLPRAIYRDVFAPRI